MNVHQLRVAAWSLGRDHAGTAIELLRIAHEREPDDLQVLWQKALFEYADDRLLEAETSLRQVIDIRPLHTEAIGLPVKVLRRLGRTDEATVVHRSSRLAIRR